MKIDSPSPTASCGRSSNGQFGPGNKAAKGNPHARHVARLRSALFKTVKPKDLRDVVAVLLAQAQAGDVASIKELLQRLLGPPVELDFVGRLDALEQQIAALQKRGNSW
jgi:hypothetical protein